MTVSFSTALVTLFTLTSLGRPTNASHTLDRGLHNSSHSFTFAYKQLTCENEEDLCIDAEMLCKELIPSAVF